MEKYCYLNGRILPLKEAALPLNDIGVLRGFGVFDFLITYNGRPFLFAEHWRRFCHSAKTLHLKIPLSSQKAAVVINKLIKKNNLKEATIRLVLTGGESADSLHFDPKRPNFFILINQVPHQDRELYRKGATVWPIEFQRELPEAKSNNYVTAIKFKNAPLPLSKKYKINELLYHKNGEIFEGATSNFFIFRGQKLITPRAGVLMGITRNFVIKLAKNKFQVEERKVTLVELKKADEAFITNTTKEILPVVRVGDIKIGSGRPGQNTKELMALFKQKTRRF